MHNWLISSLLLLFSLLVWISLTTSSKLAEAILFLVTAGQLTNIFKILIINSSLSWALSPVELSMSLLSVVSDSLPLFLATNKSCKIVDIVLYPWNLTNITLISSWSLLRNILSINFLTIKGCWVFINADMTLVTPSWFSIGSISILLTNSSFIFDSSFCCWFLIDLFSLSQAFSCLGVTPNASAIICGNNNAASVWVFPPMNFIQFGSPQ